MVVLRRRRKLINLWLHSFLKYRKLPSIRPSYNFDKIEGKLDTHSNIIPPFLLRFLIENKITPDINSTKKPLRQYFSGKIKKIHKKYVSVCDNLKFTSIKNEKMIIPFSPEFFENKTYNIVNNPTILVKINKNKTRIVY